VVQITSSRGSFSRPFLLNSLPIIERTILRLRYSAPVNKYSTCTKDILASVCFQEHMVYRVGAGSCNSNPTMGSVSINQSWEHMQGWHLAASIFCFHSPGLFWPLSRPGPGTCPTTPGTDPSD